MIKIPISVLIVESTEVLIESLIFLVNHTPCTTSYKRNVMVSFRVLLIKKMFCFILFYLQIPSFYSISFVLRLTFYYLFKCANGSFFRFSIRPEVFYFTVNVLQVPKLGYCNPNGFEEMTLQGLFINLIK